MQIVALLACTAYESDELLGLYFSREEAVLALQEFLATEEYVSYDCYAVEYRMLGARAESYLSSECIREDLVLGV